MECGKVDELRYSIFCDILVLRIFFVIIASSLFLLLPLSSLSSLLVIYHLLCFVFFRDVILGGGSYSFSLSPLPNNNNNDNNDNNDDKKNKSDFLHSHKSNQLPHFYILYSTKNTFDLIYDRKPEIRMIVEDEDSGKGNLTKRRRRRRRRRRRSEDVCVLRLFRS